MKELFIWYDKYSVNNAEIDNQHKALFNIFNRLYDHCRKYGANTTLEPIISELVSYAEYHFTAEEEYMRSIGYHDIDKHIAEHKIFTGKILLLEYSSHLNEQVTPKELIVYLWKWIKDHVLVEDKKIAFSKHKALSISYLR